MLYWLRLVDWVLSSRTVIVVISKARTFPPPFIFGDQGDSLVVRPGFGTEAKSYPTDLTMYLLRKVTGAIQLQDT